MLGADIVCRRRSGRILGERGSECLHGQSRGDGKIDVAPSRNKGDKNNCRKKAEPEKVAMCWARGGHCRNCTAPKAPPPRRGGGLGTNSSQTYNIFTSMLTPDGRSMLVSASMTFGAGF